MSVKSHVHRCHLDGTRQAGARRVGRPASPRRSMRGSPGTGARPSTSSRSKSSSKSTSALATHSTSSSSSTTAATYACAAAAISRLDCRPFRRQHRRRQFPQTPRDQPRAADGVRARSPADHHIARPDDRDPAEVASRLRTRFPPSPKARRGSEDDQCYDLVPCAARWRFAGPPGESSSRPAQTPAVTPTACEDRRGNAPAFPGARAHGHGRSARAARSRPPTT